MKGGSVMINEYINELVAYGLNQGLVDPEDEVYVTNRLLELFQLTEHEGTAKEVRSERELSQILNDMLQLIHQTRDLMVSLQNLPLYMMRRKSPDRSSYGAGTYNGRTHCSHKQPER